MSKDRFLFFISYGNGTKPLIIAGEYCGIGTIALAVAGQAGKVIGVQLNKDAVREITPVDMFPFTGNIEVIIKIILND